MKLKYMVSFEFLFDFVSIHLFMDLLLISFLCWEKFSAEFGCTFCTYYVYFVHVIFFFGFWFLKYYFLIFFASHNPNHIPFREENLMDDMPTMSIKCMNIKWHLIGRTNATAHRILCGPNNCYKKCCIFFSLSLFFSSLCCRSKWTIKSINTFAICFNILYHKIIQ